MPKKSRRMAWIWAIVFIAVVVVLFFVLRGYVLTFIYPLKYEEYIVEYASEYEVDPYMVSAVIWAESGFDEEAVSHRGAVGLMQIMPDTGEWIAEKLDIAAYRDDMLFSPETNIRFGCWYYRFLSERFPGNVQNILAAYNAGHNKVQQWLNDSAYSADGEILDIIPYEETDDYVDKVEKAYEIYRQLYEF